jgi:hypothetical protein
MNLQEDPDFVKLSEFPLYEVSKVGVIRLAGHNRIIAPSINKGGEAYVHLRSSDPAVKKRTTRSLGKLIAETFLGPPQDIEGQAVVLFKDGNKANCNLSNLVWRPRWFAPVYYKAIEDPHYAKHFVYLKHKATGHIFETRREAAIFVGEHPNLLDSQNIYISKPYTNPEDNPWELMQTLPSYVMDNDFWGDHL